jgi:hypothetical protein
VPVVYTTWIGLEEMIDEIDRVTLEENSYLITGPLNEVLFEAFADTQARVARPGAPHVTTYEPTGRLAASGRVNQFFDGRVWEGTITYGGMSHDVEYAIYEMARGGIHDWYSGLPAFDQRYMDVIHDYWEQGPPG